MSLAKILDIALWWNITLLVSSFYIYSSNVNGKYLMAVLTAIIAGLIVLRYGKNLRFHITGFHLSVLSFCTFCLTSTFWSVTPDVTLERTMTIFQILICMSVIYIYADHQKSVLPLLDTIRWAGYIMALYLFTVYGWSELKLLLQTNTRIDSELINSNVIGMILAFSVILTLYRWIFYKFSIGYLLVIPTFLLLGVANSRKAFVLLVLGCSSVVYLKYAKRNIINLLCSGIIFIVSLFLLIFLIYSLPIFDGLKYRIEGFLSFFSGTGMADGSTLTRLYMTRIGYEQFLNTPLLGGGLGISGEITGHALGYSTYFHNNYIELLASCGCIGTIVYYSMFFYPGIQLFRRRYSPDKNTAICLLLLILMLIVDWGFVSYYSKATYFFIMLFFIQSKLIQKGEKCNA